MDKETLRNQFLNKMSSLSTGDLEDKSKSIAAQFFQNFDIPSQEALHIFLSIARHNELNTFHIINRMLRDFPQVKIGVPKSDFKALTMTSYEYTLDSKMKINKLGIPEPQNGRVILPEEYTMVLVPLLCFDENGYRVGYGKGFYDRYLKQMNSKTIKIGLSLFPPVKLITDTSDWDVKLDFCITPEQIFKF